MKLKDLLCVVFLATTGMALAHGQTTKQTKQTKTPTAAAQSKQQLPFTDAHNMTVIVLYAPQGVMPRSSGSGVWIGKQGYIVTCWHVVKALPDSLKVGIARDPYVTEGKFNVRIPASADIINVKLVAHDEDTDIAILKAEKPPDKLELQPIVSVLGPPGPSSIVPQNPISPKGASIKTVFPEPGDTLLLAGFPIPQNIPNTLVLQTATATGFYSQPTSDHSPPSSALRLMLSVVSNPGNSGGPIFDVDGKVVGLLEGNLPSPIRDSQGRPMLSPIVKLDANGQPVRDDHGQPQFEIVPLNENSGISFAVPAKFIQELADNNHIKLD